MVRSELCSSGQGFLVYIPSLWAGLVPVATLAGSNIIFISNRAVVVADSLDNILLDRF